MPHSSAIFHRSILKWTAVLTLPPLFPTHRTVINHDPMRGSGKTSVLQGREKVTMGFACERAHRKWKGHGESCSVPTAVRIASTEALVIRRAASDSFQRSRLDVWGIAPRHIIDGSSIVRRVGRIACYAMQTKIQVDWGLTHTQAGMLHGMTREHNVRSKI